MVSSVFQLETPAAKEAVEPPGPVEESVEAVDASGPVEVFIEAVEALDRLKIAVDGPAIPIAKGTEKEKGKAYNTPAVVAAITGEKTPATVAAFAATHEKEKGMEQGHETPVAAATITSWSQSGRKRERSENSHVADLPDPSRQRRLSADDRKNWVRVQVAALDAEIEEKEVEVKEKEVEIEKLKAERLEKEVEIEKLRTERLQYASLL